MSELRYFETLPGRGELVCSRDAGGWRHFLDGKDVDLGAMLLMEMHDAKGTHVELGRYESRLTPEARPFGPSGATVVPATLRFADGSVRFARAEDRFAWPSVAFPGKPARKPKPRRGAR